MYGHINRRAFLGSTISSALLMSSNLAHAFDYKFTHQGFNIGDVNLLERAMGVAKEMTDKKIIENFVGFRLRGHNIAAGVWQRANVENGKLEYWRQKNHLIEWQVTSLGRWGDIPIRIVGQNQNSDALAWAKVGTVDVVYDQPSDGFKVTGEFELTINTRHFNSNGQKMKDPRTWGACIVHEMLHNLGHRHEDKDGKQNYTNEWPMIVYENCIGYCGEYRLDQPRHFAWKCSCKQ